MRLARYAVPALVLALAAPVAWAQGVALQGLLGKKALLILDGRELKTLAVGESYLGVKVISTSAEQAVVEMGGRRHILRLGEAPAHVSGGGVAAPIGKKITLTADGSGHFMAQGTIDGGYATFMVDTGASAVALGAADADRLGLNYKSGPTIRLNTANGVTHGWLVKLRSVRVGDVVVNDVEAVVSPQPMPFVLLGNSFLNHFSMRRDSELMTLDKRN